MRALLMSILLVLPFQAFAESFDECTTKCNDVLNACYASTCGDVSGPALIGCQAKCDTARVQCFNVTCAGKSSLDSQKNWNLNRIEPMFALTSHRN
jgi:hypothetical protein